jgi:Flp pilus assembly protein TadD
LALELANEALIRYPAHVGLLSIQGKAQAQLGLDDEAWDTFQRIRHLEPEEHRSYEFTALKFAQDGRLDEALELADRAVVLGASCSQAWGVRGLVHFLCEQPEEARSDLETAWYRMDARQRERWPVFWLVLFHLQNKIETAVEWHAKAYHAIPYTLIRRLLPRLEPLLGFED